MEGAEELVASSVLDTAQPLISILVHTPGRNLKMSSSNSRVTSKK